MEYERRCTADCEAEPGNYVNPTFNPLLFDENIEDPPVCECAPGYFKNDEGACVTCTDIHWDCTVCSDQYTCTQCGSDYMMLTPTQNAIVTCQEKFHHCETAELWQQPTNLTVIQYDDIYKYTCDLCEDGYYFQEPTIGSRHDGICQPCEYAMDGCDRCVSDNRCTQCQESMFLNYKQDGCQREIPNCLTRPSNYTHNRDFWVCPECIHGYYVDIKEATTQEEQCKRCDDLITGCLECDGYRCLECYPGRKLTSDGHECLSTLSNCAVDPDYYEEGSYYKQEGQKIVELDFEHHYFTCPLCDYGYFWDFYSYEDYTTGWKSSGQP